MSTPQNFRAAFNGFNRDDVVNYISYMTSKHENEVNQLRSERETLRQELNDCREQPVASEAEMVGLREQVAQLQAELRERNQIIAGLQNARVTQSAATPSLTDQELNAYRRAESAERRAIERVNQMYAKANGVLADAVVRLDDNTAQIDALSQRVQSELDSLRAAVAGSRTLLSDAATAVASIRPEE